jgi:hypothetical protein
MSYTIKKYTFCEMKIELDLSMLISIIWIIQDYYEQQCDFCVTKYFKNQATILAKILASHENQLAKISTSV